MTPIEEALNWADTITLVPIPDFVTQSYGREIKYLKILAREYRKEKKRADDAVEALERVKYLSSFNPSLNEALNSGDGTYKP